MVFFLYMYEIRSGSAGVLPFLTYQTFMIYFIQNLFDIYMATLVLYNGFANDMYLHLYMFDVYQF